MKEEGIVAEVTENAVTIEIKPEEECHKCGICGAGRKRRITLGGEEARGLIVGDKVELEIEPSKMLKLYSLLYGVPLAAFVGTVGIIYAFLQNPLVSFLGAVAIMIVSYIVVGCYMKNRQVFTPKVLKKGENDGRKSKRSY